MIEKSFAARQGEGTRFRLYPQAPLLAGYRTPVVVELSPVSGSLAPGPSDGRVCVISPIGKAQSYGQLMARHGVSRPILPPWRGPVLQPAVPDQHGHFDHLGPKDVGFAQAHAYACIRLTLDVWERYLGRRIQWNFTSGLRWLEVGLLDSYTNGECSWGGWLELGSDVDPDRPPHPFALNLDVVAHEVGHLLVYSLVGLPPSSNYGEYAGFQESAADLVALLVAAQLPTVVNEVLKRTRGNLYVANELNRLGELSSNSQIRQASNSARLSEFALGWSDEHDLSEPLTGALFDLLVDMYQHELVERQLIPPSLDRLVREVGHLRPFAPRVQAEFDRWYPVDPQGFRRALTAACDRLGTYMAHALARLRSDRLTYVAVQKVLTDVDRALGGGLFGHAIADNFAWRDIGRVDVGPYLGMAGGAPSALELGVHRCAKRDLVPRQGNSRD